MSTFPGGSEYTALNSLNRHVKDNLDIVSIVPFFVKNRVSGLYGHIHGDTVNADREVIAP